MCEFKFLVAKKNQNWKKIFLLLFKSVISKLKKKNINIVLTGGNTVKKFYKFWAKNFMSFNKKYNFFLSDERLFVKKKETNIYNIKSNFFSNLIKTNFNYYEINSNPKNIFRTVNDYSKKFKKNDICILSLGSDGHLASIFDKRNILKKYFYCKVNNEYPERISISINEIQSTKFLIILVIGYKKGIQLKKSISDKKSILRSILSKNNNFFLIDYYAYKGYSI